MLKNFNQTLRCCFHSECLWDEMEVLWESVENLPSFPIERSLLVSHRHSYGSTSLSAINLAMESFCGKKRLCVISRLWVKGFHWDLLRHCSMHHGQPFPLSPTQYALRHERLSLLPCLTVSFLKILQLMYLKFQIQMKKNLG